MRTTKMKGKGYSMEVEESVEKMSQNSGIDQMINEVHGHKYEKRYREAFTQCRTLTELQNTFKWTTGSVIVVNCFSLHMV